MHIIDATGNIVEGQELNSEELAILTDLVSVDGVIYSCTSAYIASGDRKRIAAALIAKYHISYREQPVVTQEVE